MAKSFIPRNVDFIIQNASRNESEVVFTANVIVTITPSGCFFNFLFSGGVDGVLGAAMFNSGVNSSPRLVGQAVSLELHSLFFFRGTFIHFVL